MRILVIADAAATALAAGDIRMDLLTHKVTRGTRAVELLPTDWRLPEYMLRHQGEVQTRTMLLEKA